MDFIEEAFKLETGIEATNHSLHSVSHHLFEEIPSDQNYAALHIVRCDAKKKYQNLDEKCI